MIRFALAATLTLSLTACAQQPPAAPSPASAPVATNVTGPDNTRNALLFAGGDIGARINAALADCHHKCTVRVPAGNYSFATTIHLPLMHQGGYLLDLDPGAVLTYTGSADAIRAPSNGLNLAGLVFHGGQLVGTEKAQAGIHTFPTNKITVREMTIRGFSHGDGIRIEGTNSVLIEDNTITQNRVGLHLTGTHCADARDASGDLICGQQAGGAGYAPNAIHVISNSIVENAAWGIWEDWSPGVTAALDNLYLGNNLEANGGRPNSGAVWLAFSRATQVIGNYFEGAPPYLLIGSPRYPPSVGVAVRGNYFTTTANTPISIDLLHAEDTMIEDNTEYDPFASSPTPCFLNLGDETGTYLGKNHIEARSIACRGGKPATLSPAVYASSPLLGQFIGQLTTSPGASDALPVPGLSPAAHCAAFAANAPAAALTGLYTEAGTGAVTVHHSPQAGGKLNVFCSFE